MVISLSLDHLLRLSACRRQWNGFGSENEKNRQVFQQMRCDPIKIWARGRNAPNVTWLVATERFFIFNPKIGEDEPNLTSIFSKGLMFNHQQCHCFFPSLVLWLGDSNFSASYRLWGPSVNISTFHRAKPLWLGTFGPGWTAVAAQPSPCGPSSRRGTAMGCVDNDSWSLEF